MPNPKLLLALILLLTSCSLQSPLHRALSEKALSTEIVKGADFFHRVIRPSSTPTDPEVSTLHVYIEGDGRPWVTPTQKAKDPTPRQPLALTLMGSARRPGNYDQLYLGRPCYFDTQDPLCNEPAIWTSGRYSHAVIRSMNTALDHFAQRYQHLVLIGYSGGGTIAYLMAAERTDVATLITVAANLDTDAWAQHHQFTPLRDSLNPAAAGPLPNQLRQIHWRGGEDDISPPSLLPSFLLDQPNVEIRVRDTFTHRCCWTDFWPSFKELEDL